jgi:uncharacterized protein with HEPN domain
MKGKIADRERLGHILDCISEIQAATINVSEEDFTANHVLRMAVVKWMEIIGEAVNMISVEAKAKSDNVPWNKIVSFRHFVVHEYFGIDFTLVWAIVKQELELLKTEVEILYKNS